jgi:N-acetylglucosamine kinase-like BadF-type ATPase
MLLLGMDGEAQRLVAFGVDRLSLAGSLAASLEPWPAATRSHLVAPLGDAVADALQLARDVAESASDLTVSRRLR